MIEIKLGDITQEDTQVIVNAANAGLKGGGGVDGAIHRAAGPTVMEECRKIGSCATGQAVMTGAGKLKVNKIIHTVGPVWAGGKKEEPRLLKNCYENSLLLAQKHGFDSIAFLAISTGAYGYPVELAARIALDAAKKFEKDFSEIRFVCFSKEDFAVYRKIWKEMGA